MKVMMRQARRVQPMVIKKMMEKEREKEMERVMKVVKSLQKRCSHHHKVLVAVIMKKGLFIMCKSIVHCMCILYIHTYMYIHR